MPDFFDVYNGNMATRRKVLFNLYAFDEYHTSQRKVPSLTIRRCKFSKFMSGEHEALITVDTNNLYPITSDTDPNEV